MSQSSMSIQRMAKVFGRPFTMYELRTVGGFTIKQIERAIKDHIIVPVDRVHFAIVEQ